jgi:hypothetical protein
LSKVQQRTPVTIVTGVQFFDPNQALAGKGVRLA